MVDCGHIAHLDVIFLRVLLRNMTSICLLSLIYQKNRLENVVEYGCRWRSTLKKPSKVELQRWCGSSCYL